MTDDCKKRWKNIRDTYVKEKNTFDRISRSKWKKIIEHLSFLDPIEYERKFEQTLNN